MLQILLLVQMVLQRIGFLVPVINTAFGNTGLNVTAPNGFVTGGDPWRPFSNGLSGSTEWLSSVVANSYLEITFPYSVTITGVILAGRLTTSTQYFTNFQIQGSNNNSTWNNIYLAGTAVTQTVTK